MCGITGIFAFNEVGRFFSINVAKSNATLSRRGPDYANLYTDDRVHLGHSRLSIIDLDYRANQPMQDESQRYVIVYNGEIFNYRALRQQLQAQGVSFFSESDTEVLLKLYIRYGADCLAQLNGFFAFAIYDRQAQSLFLARDRFGVKPLLYYMDEDKFLFASEMKALLSYGLEKQIDNDSLLFYLQLNYIPAPHTILQNVWKVMPGHWLLVKKRVLENKAFYQVPIPKSTTLVSPTSYAEQCQQLYTLLQDAVQSRLVADVPVGTFLSGGLDSAIVTALAAQSLPDLKTFTIRIKDNQFLDESPYAQWVADQYKTNHTVLETSSEAMLQQVMEALDYLDEPFADSSALAVYHLCKQANQHVKVALSGDGADEVFGGYQKHYAEYLALHPNWKTTWVKKLAPLWKWLPQARNIPLANKFRQLSRFAEGALLPAQERYWFWATFMQESKAQAFAPVLQCTSTYLTRKNTCLQALPTAYQASLNEVLWTDTTLVLPNDMLFKVDSMSMANSLEVRNPFLDHRVVNFAFGLPDDWKVAGKQGKKILRDTFGKLLPPALLKRPKKGFEIPLRQWLTKELQPLVNQYLLDEQRLIAQGIFDVKMIHRLVQQLHSSNPQDSHATVWALLVFQHWWQKYMH